MAWSMALALLLASGIPVAAAEPKGDGTEVLPTCEAGPNVGTADSGAAAVPDGGKEPPKTVAESPKTSSPKGMAQFVIPKSGTAGKAPTVQLPQRLTYQYSYASQSDVIYRRESDLDRRLRDDSFVITPQLSGYVTYRPTDWLETTLEMIIDREIPVSEEAVVTLPNGETQVAAQRQLSLRVDQAFIVFKGAADRFRFTVGRRNYEDERHWLFDTSLDIVGIWAKLGKFRAEAVVGREVLLDLDLLGPGEAAVHQQGAKRKKDLINTYMLLADYRGIEDIKLGAYMVFRDDRERTEGRPLLMGLQSHGMPSDTFSYWAEVGFVGGTDEASRTLSGYGFDVGATYRFGGVPLHPNVTLAYAFGSGDGHPGEGRNGEFRQTGLHSNEAKFAGPAKFKRYGEVLDPELSNLAIMTAGVGVRPALNVSIDVVYHHYRLNEIAAEVRNAALTAEMNQVEGQSSRDVGSALDVVLGFRSLFGVRRLGVDLRAGWFFPGKAFLVNDGSSESPSVRNADNGFTIVTKFWW
jgi:alginate production protein